MNKRHTIRNLVVALSLASATLFVSPVVGQPKDQAEPNGLNAAVSTGVGSILPS